MCSVRRYSNKFYSAKLVKMVTGDLLRGLKRANQNTIGKTETLLGGALQDWDKAICIDHPAKRDRRFSHVTDSPELLLAT